MNGCYVGGICPRYLAHFEHHPNQSSVRAAGTRPSRASLSTHRLAPRRSRTCGPRPCSRSPTWVPRAGSQTSTRPSPPSWPSAKVQCHSPWCILRGFRRSSVVVGAWHPVALDVRISSPSSPPSAAANTLQGRSLQTAPDPNTCKKFRDLLAREVNSAGMQACGMHGATVSWRSGARVKSVASVASVRVACLMRV
jgi:hypothetical protein